MTLEGDEEQGKSDEGSESEGSPQETQKKDEVQGKETESEASKGKEKEEEGEEGQEEEPPVIDLKSVNKDADGNLVWVSNPDDPKNSSVYKGKDLDELFANVGKGITEKDSYIRKLRSQGLAPTKERRSPASSDADEVRFPEYGDILARAIKQYRLPEEFLQYSREDWKAYEAANGAVETIEMKQLVKEVKRAADSAYSEANIKAINDKALDEETESVEAILAEYDIPASDFEEVYDAILEAVWKDKGNFNAQGVLKNGRIAALATKEIKKLYDTKVTGRVSKAKDEEAALNRKKKGEVSTDGPGRKTPSKPSEQKYRTTEEVTESILREMGLSEKKQKLK